MSLASPSLTPELDAAIELADGRALSYGVLGDPDGAATIMVLDGPGSRGLARAAAPAAAALGLRLIAPDRPGFFGRSPAPGPHVRRLARPTSRLLDALGLRARAPRPVGRHALRARARRRGARAGHRALAGPRAVAARRGRCAGRRRPDARALVLARRAPWLLRPLSHRGARHAARPRADRAALRRRRAAARRAALDDERVWQLHVRTTAESLEAPAERGARGGLLARPWGIDLGAIRAPVALWVGERDVTHPPVMSRRLAARLGDAPVTVVPGAATFGLLPVLGDALAFAAGAHPVPEARPA